MKRTIQSAPMLRFALPARDGTAVTAQGVAQHLGLSISTIGRALADDPRISPATKARVQAAAESLGYVANEAARMMRGGSSKLVGLMLPDIRNDFYATIAQALSACCDREGYRLALCITEDDRDLEARQVKDLVAARVAGIIVVPTASPRREALAMLCSVPRVQLLRNLPALSADWFGIDDEHCLQAGTRHLVDLGHRRIAYIGGEPALPTGVARMAGFRAAFRGRRRQCDECCRGTGSYHYRLRRAGHCSATCPQQAADGHHRRFRSGDARRARNPACAEGRGAGSDFDCRLR